MWEIRQYFIELKECISNKSGALNLHTMYDTCYLKPRFNLQNKRTVNNHIPRLNRREQVSACLMFLNWKTKSKEVVANNLNSSSEYSVHENVLKCFFSKMLQFHGRRLKRCRICFNLV